MLESFNIDRVVQSDYYMNFLIKACLFLRFKNYLKKKIYFYFFSLLLSY